MPPIDEVMGTVTGDDANDVAAEPPPPATDEALSPASVPTAEGEPAAEEEELTPEAQAEADKAARSAERVKAADAAEKRSEAERAKRRRAREDGERVARIEARERQAEELLERAQQIARDVDERRQRVLTGGEEGLKALGIDYPTLTQRFVEGTGAEAIARQALERAERLERELARSKEEQTRAREAADVQTSKLRFEGFVETNAADFPFAADLPPRFLHALAVEVAEEYALEHTSRGAYERGQRVYPTFGALVERLDERAKAVQEEREARSAKRARAETTPGNGAKTQAGNGNGQASQPTTRTLTSASAAMRATAKTRQMTPEEEDEWALNELRQAMKADSKASA